MTQRKVRKLGWTKIGTQFRFLPSSSELMFRVNRLLVFEGLN